MVSGESLVLLAGGAFVADRAGVIDLGIGGGGGDDKATPPIPNITIPGMGRAEGLRNEVSQLRTQMALMNQIRGLGDNGPTIIPMNLPDGNGAGPVINWPELPGYTGPEAEGWPFDRDGSGDRDDGSGTSGGLLSGGNYRDAGRESTYRPTMALSGYSQGMLGGIVEGFGDSWDNAKAGAGDVAESLGARGQAGAVDVTPGLDRWDVESGPLKRLQESRLREYTSTDRGQEASDYGVSGGTFNEDTFKKATRGSGKDTGHTTKNRGGSGGNNEDRDFNRRKALREAGISTGAGGTIL